jgi:hypothetical protein
MERLAAVRHGTARFGTVWTDKVVFGVERSGEPSSDEVSCSWAWLGMVRFGNGGSGELRLAISFLIVDGLQGLFYDAHQLRPRTRPNRED